MTYLDGDTLDQCLQALRDGQTLDDLAGKLHYEPSHLARLLGLPTCQPAAQQDADQSVDLWAVDRAHGQL